ncbi:hypothetical protein M430DRAFT_17704 [Amorphotheca resinae ATCC 22711]|uniref:Uncharacterized protein n=1 Tax=Amorphotheca resinae ATCC 22711 TaxID=857342 RepID=A0A2T3B5V3_AMORE|nr:hypothetical protein M430DRAFT_17704 [Amorphotheca resinae ATCC 22711]PSS22144.1 hypothetical protein M430DRAFT_17704 [Amorphotheca resinae ATCC 22711]
MPTPSLPRHRASSAADSNLDALHPILENFHLPVELEGAPKRSGVHNLLREGWDEDQCRRFPLKHASVPRDLNYKDGLMVIHPLLQERFGDENMDLAIGVLEE